MENNELKNNIADVLQDKGKGKHKKRLVLVIVLIAVVVIVVNAMQKKQQDMPVVFDERDVKTGNLTETVTATGTLEPTNEVEVGSELSGIIEKVYVDYNDNVKVGQLLAKLNVSKLEAQVKQSKASLEAAKAKVLQADATIKETSSKLEQLKKVKALSEGKVPSQTTLDQAEADYARAVADKASAEAEVAEVQANLDINETDLKKAEIYSPVDGVVLSRSIEVGQTVAASFEAPVLFDLAEDLTKMELHVDVDEADIGVVREGQEAIFTVDAYPEKNFEARISQVRYAASTTDGVVTYETILTVDNSQLMLRPGMTATAEIIVKKAENAIIVPSAALRFTPAVTGPQQQKKSIIDSILPHPPHRDEQKNQEVQIIGSSKQKVYKIVDGRPMEVPVTIGITDGINTEIVSGDIKAGEKVIVDTVTSGLNK